MDEDSAAVLALVFGIATPAKHVSNILAGSHMYESYVRFVVPILSLNQQSASGAQGSHYERPLPSSPATSCGLSSCRHRERKTMNTNWIRVALADRGLQAKDLAKGWGVTDAVASRFI